VICFVLSTSINGEGWRMDVDLVMTVSVVNDGCIVVHVPREEVMITSVQ